MEVERVVDSVCVTKCIHVSLFPLVSADLLSVPPGFEKGVSFSDPKEEQGWSL